MRPSAGRRPGPLRRLIMSLRGRSADPVARDDSVLQDCPYGSDPAQCMDVYGAGRGADLPVLVMVHGGAWTIGDKARPAVVAEKVNHWLPRGWIFVSLNYRTLPSAGPLEQAADIALALAAIQRLAPDWGGDAQRCVLMGHSSGAHISALAVVAGAVRAHGGAATPVAMVLLDSAALDVVRVMEGEPRRFHRRAFGDDAGQWRAASPVHQMVSAPPPTLLLCSNQRDGAIGQAEAFAERARTLGGRAAVVPLPLDHAELNRTIGQPGPATEAIDSFLASLGLP